MGKSGRTVFAQVRNVTDVGPFRDTNK